MLLIPALFTLHPARADINVRTLLFLLIGIIFILLIGLRHEVGGDWDRYISIFSFHKGIDLDFSKFTSSDYAYEAIHWLSLNYLDGIYSTNLICAIFFVLGLIRFCRATPFPWVALFVSINFLVIVVSMGYTRQGAAMGFLLWALVDLIKGKTIRFYIYIVLAVLFHKVALIMFPVGYMYHTKNFSMITFTMLIALLYILIFVLMMEKIQHMYLYYIQLKFHHSDGALIRVFISFVTAIIFFIYRGKFKQRFDDEKLWYIFSVVSIALLPLAYYYSTFADRIAIFFLPLQLIILSRVPVLIESAYNRTIFILAVFIVYFSALFVWLFFGNFSSKWLPYQNILLVN
jgi:hypothetical protein